MRKIQCCKNENDVTNEWIVIQLRKFNFIQIYDNSIFQFAFIQNFQFNNYNVISKYICKWYLMII